MGRGVESRVLLLVGHVWVFLARLDSAYSEVCPVSSSSGTVITLDASHTGKEIPLVNPSCLSSSTTQPTNLTYIIVRRGYAQCIKSYIIISGNVTGPGRVEIHSARGWYQPLGQEILYLEGEDCSDLIVQYYGGRWQPGHGPYLQLFYDQPGYCEDVLRRCSVSVDQKHICLPLEWRCNGRDDCPGGIDESECQSCCTRRYNVGVCYSQDYCKCELSGYHRPDSTTSEPLTIDGCNGVAITTELGKTTSSPGWYSVVNQWPLILPLNRSYTHYYFDDANFTIKFNEIVVGERDTALLHYQNTAIDLRWTKAGQRKTIQIKRNNGITLSFVMKSPYSVYNFSYTDDVKYLVGAAPCDSLFNRACLHNNLCYAAQQRCNKHMDCPNGKDELGCGTILGKCEKDQIMCVGEAGQGEAGCFTQHERCDGNKQCTNGYDEKGCDSQLCGTHNGTYLCADDGLCIFETWKCDKSKDCADGADELKCEGTSLKVVTASVIGSLVCSIMIVIAVGCSCKLHTNRMYETISRRSRYESPMTRITNELMRRAAPPPYAEAMQRSRPFEEVQSEYLAALAQQRHDDTTEDSAGAMEEEQSVASASGTLDPTDTSLVQVSEDNSVTYRRNPNKPVDTSSHADLSLVPHLVDQPSIALDPKSDEEEEGGSESQTTNRSYNASTESSSSPSRRQIVRHNSVDSDVSLLSRDSDDVPLLT